MTQDDTALVPSDLLFQAVEGMDRPLFVLDEDWRFSYVNPAGARALALEVGDLVGRNIWAAFPEAVGGPFDELYRSVRRTGRPGGSRRSSARWAGGSAPTRSSPTQA